MSPDVNRLSRASARSPGTRCSLRRVDGSRRATCFGLDKRDNLRIGLFRRKTVLSCVTITLTYSVRRLDERDRRDSRYLDSQSRRAKWLITRAFNRAPRAACAMAHSSLRKRAGRLRRLLSPPPPSSPRVISRGESYFRESRFRFRARAVQLARRARRDFREDRLGESATRGRSAPALRIGSIKTFNKLQMTWISRA